MRFGSRRLCRLGLGLWIALAPGCSAKKDEPATREDCAKAAEHIADLIIADAKAHPDALWDGVHADGADPEIPAAVTKEKFKAWIDGAEGQTWMMQRRGQVMAATQKGIDSCVKSATKRLTSCLLDARSKVDIDACDKAHPSRTAVPPPASSGSGGEVPPVGSVPGSGPATP
jgi:hypothetical protein